MKTLLLPLALVATAFSLFGSSHALAFGPYFNPYDGSAAVTTGKKTGTLVAAANASTTDGSDASVIVSGQGAKGIQVNANLAFSTKGVATLTLTAKVLADPRQANKGDKIPSGKKVVVRIKARGTYTVVDANTATFVVSGNSGKGGGTNVTGTLTTTPDGAMSLSLQSGFKQKLSGVGRKLQFSFTGSSSTVPLMP